MTSPTATRLAHLPGFADSSRVWFYIADRPISPAHQEEINQQLGAFVRSWTAHHVALKAAGELYAGRILLLMVDESGAGASGCSIDTSVKWIQSVGSMAGVDFFDPFTCAWMYTDESTLQFGPLDSFRKAIAAKGTEGLRVINSQVKTKADMQDRFLLELSSVWQNRFV